MMEYLLDENMIKKLKQENIIIKNERDEAKAALHMVTVHCCKLIAEKDNKDFTSVWNEITEIITEITSRKCN